MTSDIRVKSVKALYDHMKLAKESSDESYNWLISKCDRQSSLAGLSRKSAGIHGMSLNTFKKYADDHVNGGYAAVDTLRRSLCRNDKPKVELQKGRLKEKNADLRRRLEEAERFRAIILKAYSDLNRIALDAISASPQHSYDYQRHQELYGKYFGLTLIIDNE